MLYRAFVIHNWSSIEGVGHTALVSQVDCIEFIRVK